MAMILKTVLALAASTTALPTFATISSRASTPASNHCGAPDSSVIVSGTPWIVYSMNYNYQVCSEDETVRAGQRVLTSLIHGRTSKGPAAPGLLASSLARTASRSVPGAALGISKKLPVPPMFRRATGESIDRIVMCYSGWLTRTSST